MLKKRFLFFTLFFLISIVFAKIGDGQTDDFGVFVADSGFLSWPSNQYYFFIDRIGVV